MIRKQDILDRATEWQLRPEVVEKDYVLGWLLIAIASSPIREHWIFKGGTCIKKCFFETYRFSEDLDFSLLPAAAYAEPDIQAALAGLTGQAQNLSGIEFPTDQIEVRPRQNKQGERTFQCRIPYRGPLAIPGPPRVLIDLTQHEPVLDPPGARAVLHPYPDALAEGAVLAYSFDELLAEKTRALFERARPRDLYDVVYLLENRPEGFDLPRVRDLFQQKCASKGLTPPTAGQLVEMAARAEELRSEWANMLAHQLPVLPGLDALLTRLPDLLQWIDEPAAVLPALALVAPPIPQEAEPVVVPGIRLWGGGVPLEALRFAGANRLLVEFTYDGKHRVAEPYSLRRARTTGNLLLYAWEQGSTHIKAFNVAKIQGLRTTTATFVPRYRIELTGSGIGSAPLAAARPRLSLASPVRPPRGVPARPVGPKYVFTCTVCQKRFRHSTNDARLAKHKAPGGWDCPGRTGYLTRVE